MQGLDKKQAISRDEQIDAFLEEAGFSGALRKKLSGDASFRRYERVNVKNTSYILMDAPPGKEDVRPFIKIARFLVEQGFSAPKIIAEDIDLGLLLLEDFGDDLFAKVMEREKNKEKELYLEALKTLTKLNKKPISIQLKEYDDALLLAESSLFIDWFAEKYKKIKLSDNEKENFNSILTGLFPKTRKQNKVLVLRDYHAENLMWLPTRNGIEKVGLLDFQDAVIGNPAYDLASLLQDARRDVSANLEEELLAEYLKMNPEINQESFLAAYNILSAQRNLKIIGIFARLFIRDGKDVYLKLIPRVWNYLERDVAAKGLEELKKWLDKNIPKDLRK